jgi:hypothetical protein
VAPTIPYGARCPAGPGARAVGTVQDPATQRGDAPLTRPRRWWTADWPPGARGPAWSAATFLAEYGRGSRPGVLLGSGREALAFLLRALGAAGRAVLLPAYGCPALTQAVHLAGATPVYHPGDETMRPDEVAVRHILARGGVAAWVLVHPLGWLQTPPRWPLPPGVALVEDTSHTLCNAPGQRVLGAAWGVGTAASLRKCLPVTAGLAARWDGDVPPPPPLPSAAAAAHAAARTAAWAAADPWRRHDLLARAEEALAGVPATTAPAPGGATPEALAALAAPAGWDLETWRRRCRANWLALGELLRAVPGARPLHPTLPDGICPLGFALRHPNRTALARRLLRRGLAAAWHWQPPAAARPAMGRGERVLAATILTLPCDARYTPADMEEITRILAEEAAAL